MATTAETSKQRDWIDRLFMLFATSVFADRRESSKPLRWAFLIVGVFAVLLAASPRVWVTQYFLDLFVPLDGAWRMHNGQVPHLDFYTPVGDLYYLILKIAAALFGMQPKLVIWANLLMVPVAAAATAYSSRDRLPNSLRAVLVVTVSLLCMSPRSLDTLSNISFLASYNRHSWTLLIPLAFMTIASTGSVREKKLAVTDGILQGLLILALLYLKVTFGLVALAITFVSIIFVPENRRACIISLGVVCIFIAIFSAVSPINRAYVADLARASKVVLQKGDAGAETNLAKVSIDIASDWFELAMPVAFAFWMGRTAHTLRERDLGNRLLLLVMATCAMSIMLAWQNHDHIVPLQIGVMAVVVASLLQRYRQRHAPSSESSSIATGSPFELPGGKVSVVLAAVVFFFMCANYIIADGRAIIVHFLYSVADNGKPAATFSPTVSDIRLKPGAPSDLLSDILAGKTDPVHYGQESADSWTNDMATIMDNGWQLERQHEPKDPHIATLGFVSIMSYMTLTPPPKHLPAWLDAHRTVGLGAPMDPETTYDDTNVVMVLKVFQDKIFYDMVAAYLTKNFSLVGETPLWQMWVRQSDLKPAGQ
ncbi:MAG TPA: hypothetical protein VN229_25505 [Terriglobales bacterium]|nr:hypothetical protein [Terriglobales bacterium]